MTVYDHQLAPLDAPTISLHGSKPDTLHIHLPGDLAFNEGVDIPLNLEGLRLLYDVLQRREYLARVQRQGTAMDQRASAILSAFKSGDMHKVRKVAADPVLVRAEQKRKKRDKELEKLAKQKAEREALESELGFSLDELLIDL
jgi:RNA polymerase-interacting CarD/CdnL/TRCF family regulator